MSKGNDINVGSIEEDIKILKELMEDVELTFAGWVDILKEREKKALKNLIQDYTRQKQINEEYKKENSLLREKIKELKEENNEMKSLFEIQASIAKELEFSEKDKMIKFRGNFYIPDTMTLNAEIGKEKRIELSYVDVSRLLENRIVKS